MTPDHFSHSYHGEVLTRGNVSKDSLCTEEGPGAYKNVCSAKAQPTNIAEYLWAVSLQKHFRLSATHDPLFSPLENYLHNPGLFPENT